MNTNFDKILERANVQYLRSALLGKAFDEIQDKPYKERLDGPRRELLKMIEEKLPDMEDNEPLNEKIYNSTGAYADVYMELGLQAGVKIAMDILTAGITEVP